MREAVLKTTSNERMLDYLFQKCPYEQFEALRPRKHAASSPNVVKRLMDWFTGDKPAQRDPYPEYYVSE